MFGASQNNPNSGWEAKAVEFFKDHLKEKDAQTWVPSLNDVPLHYMKPNSLVKFRCLIQDMFDPEFYMGAYEAVDPSTKAKVLKCGKYKDVMECGVDLNSKNTVTAERQTFYCVPIPGESPWVKESYASSSQARVVPSTSYVPTRQKRSYEEDDDDMDTQPQKQREQHTGLQSPTEHHGNGEKAPPCLVKVYAEWDGFKLNDTLEVYGILSVSPALSALADEKDAASSSFLDPADSMETAEEQRVHCPPASLVPRIHMLYAKPLPHNNPLLPPTLEDNTAFLSSTLSEMAAVRAELLTYFTHILLGDALAAEYLILHLISNVYSRRDILPLGKFSLNLSGCPTVSSYTERLYQVIQQLVPSSFYLAMSLQNMNQMKFVPKKDYVANRLVSGALQLAKHTSLFLDEIQLEQGQLDTTGVHNITALGNLISWQKRAARCCRRTARYTYSLRSPPPSMEEYLSSLHMHPQASQLNKFRMYLSVARLLDYSISDEMTKSVEDDFVDMRKDDPQSVSAEDLHSMLVVSRLLSLSLGLTSLCTDSWLRAKHMEVLRRSRVEQQKCLNGNEP
ncbi:hypothetical protein CesoFtcFv8_020709 [Champsocephalus esox]|uniref:Mini-chromosome maintenance complex-binding protein n=1 Tax=Champsocephalus esox TaxID=159716 RepID=A0AAN8BBD6_9TELE|nr:hypothetical protein CesoFtcFv8_020709 [Champsocephalus esox]